MTVQLFETCEHERAAQGRAVLDSTINQLFGVSVTLAAVLGREQMSAEATDRIHDVIDELDRAASALRSGVAAFTAPSASGAPDGLDRRRSVRICPPNSTRWCSRARSWRCGCATRSR